VCVYTVAKLPFFCVANRYFIEDNSVNFPAIKIESDKHISVVLFRSVKDDDMVGLATVPLYPASLFVYLMEITS
jgi:hypothetical protein